MYCGSLLKAFASMVIPSFVFHLFFVIAANRWEVVSILNDPWIDNLCLTMSATTVAATEDKWETSRKEGENDDEERKSFLQQEKVKN